jgi:hypothetical protein
MRGEVRVVADRRVLVDCYNANPAAMAAALTTLAELAAGGHALAVLGDMLELGPRRGCTGRPGVVRDAELWAVGRTPPTPRGADAPGRWAFAKPRSRTSARPGPARGPAQGLAAPRSRRPGLESEG